MKIKISFIAFFACFVTVLNVSKINAQCEISAYATNIFVDCANPDPTIANTMVYDVVVEYSNIPPSGNLRLRNRVGNSNIATVAVGGVDSPTTHTFTGVSINMNTGEPDLYVDFSAETSCRRYLHVPLYDCDGCAPGNTIGTYSSQVATDGTVSSVSGNDEYILNYGGDVTFLHNDDYAYTNNDADWGPSNSFDQLEYFFYSCEPTVTNHPYMDPCLIVFPDGEIASYNSNILAFSNPDFKEISLGDNSDLINYVNTFLTLPDNKVWVVASVGDYFGADLNIPANCFESGEAFSIQYLNQIIATESPTCATGVFEFNNIIGGHPEFYGGNFTISNNGAGTLSATSVSYNGSFNLSGLSDGNAYSVTITDVNGGETTYSGTFSCGGGGGDTECSSCLVPSCPIAGPYTSMAQAEGITAHCSQQNPILPNISQPNSFISYHTVVASSSGELGVVISTGYGLGSCSLNRDAKLFIPGECTSDINEITAGKVSTSPSFGVGFEWTGLIPGATYTVVISTAPSAGCSIEDQCVSYYQPTTCDISNVTYTTSNTDCNAGTFDVAIEVTFQGAPINGQMRLRDMDIPQDVVGQNPNVNTITSPYTYNLTGLSIDGTDQNYGVYFSQETGCSNTITVVDPTCVIPCDAGSNQSVCGSSATLAATQPAAGSWTVVTGTGTFTNDTDPGTLVTGLSVGVNEFQWSDGATGTCFVTITSTQITANDFTIDSCDNNAVDFTLTDYDLQVGSGIVTWFTDALRTNPAAAIVNVPPGSSVVLYSILTESACADSSELTLRVNSLPNADFTISNSDGSLGSPCDGALVDGNVISPDEVNNTYTWSTGATGISVNDVSDDELTLVVEDVNTNCSATTTQTISRFEATPLTIQATDFCEDSSSIVSIVYATGQDVNTFPTRVWEDVSNVNIPELNPGEIEITTSTTGIQLLAEDVNGCAVSSNIIDVNEILFPLSDIDYFLTIGEEYKGYIIEAITNADGVYWAISESGKFDYDTINNDLILYNQFPLTETDYILNSINVGNGIVCKSLDTLSRLVINPNYEIPNVITPNGDDVNDYFYIKNAEFMQALNIKIFNRWGSLLFETNSKLRTDGWNGLNQNGNEVSEGVYIYLIEVTEFNGEKQLYNGTVQLIK